MAQPSNTTRNPFSETETRAVGVAIESSRADTQTGNIESER